MEEDQDPTMKMESSKKRVLKRSSSSPSTTNVNRNMNAMNTPLEVVDHNDDNDDDDDDDDDDIVSTRTTTDEAAEVRNTSALEAHEEAIVYRRESDGRNSNNHRPRRGNSAHQINGATNHDRDDLYYDDSDHDFISTIDETSSLADGFLFAPNEMATYAKFIELQDKIKAFAFDENLKRLPDSFIIISVTNDVHEMFAYRLCAKLELFLQPTIGPVLTLNYAPINTTNNHNIYNNNHSSSSASTSSEYFHRQGFDNFHASSKNGGNDVHVWSTETPDLNIESPGKLLKISHRPLSMRSPVYSPLILAGEKSPEPLCLAASLQIQDLISRLSPDAHNKFHLKRERAMNELERMVKEWVQDVCSLKQQQRISKAVVSSSSSEQAALNYGGLLALSGSYTLGVADDISDVDAVCIVPRQVSRTDFFQSLFKRLQSNPRVTSVYSLPDARIPLICLRIDGISVDLLMARIAQLETIPSDIDITNDDLLTGMGLRCVLSLSGPRNAWAIRDLVGRNFASFSVALRIIRFWAYQRGIYSGKLGYLGGISWAIMVAFICQLIPNAEPGTLVLWFFRIFSRWNWKEDPVRLTLTRSASNDGSTFLGRDDDDDDATIPEFYGVDDDSLSVYGVGTSATLDKKTSNVSTIISTNGGVGGALHTTTNRYQGSRSVATTGGLGTESLGGVGTDTRSVSSTHTGDIDQRWWESPRNIRRNRSSSYTTGLAEWAKKLSTERLVDTRVSNLSTESVNQAASSAGNNVASTTTTTTTTQQSNVTSSPNRNPLKVSSFSSTIGIMDPLSPKIISQLSAAPSLSSMTIPSSSAASSVIAGPAVIGGGGAAAAASSSSSINGNNPHPKVRSPFAPQNIRQGSRVVSLMPIIAPTFPPIDTASKLSLSAFHAIQEELRRGCELLDLSHAKGQLTSNVGDVFVKLLEPYNIFPDFEAFFRVYVSAPTQDAWARLNSFTLSRLARLVEMIQDLSFVSKVRLLPCCFPSSNSTTPGGEFEVNNEKDSFSGYFIIGFSRTPMATAVSKEDESEQVAEIERTIRFFRATSLDVINNLPLQNGEISITASLPFSTGPVAPPTTTSAQQMYSTGTFFQTNEKDGTSSAQVTGGRIATHGIEAFVEVSKIARDVHRIMMNELVIRIRNHRYSVNTKNPEMLLENFSSSNKLGRVPTLIIPVAYSVMSLPTTTLLKSQGLALMPTPQLMLGQQNLYPYQTSIVQHVQQEPYLSKGSQPHYQQQQQQQHIHQLNLNHHYHQSSMIQQQQQPPQIVRNPRKQQYHQQTTTSLPVSPNHRQQQQQQQQQQQRPHHHHHHQQQQQQQQSQNQKIVNQQLPKQQISADTKPQQQNPKHTSSDSNKQALRGNASHNNNNNNNNRKANNNNSAYSKLGDTNSNKKPHIISSGSDNVAVQKPNTSKGNNNVEKTRKPVSILSDTDFPALS